MSRTPQYTIHHVPFLRLLLPLVAGIVWQHFAPSTLLPYVWCAIALACGTAVWLLRSKKAQRAYNVAFTGATTAIMIAIGALSCSINTTQEQLPALQDNTLAIARIEEHPTEQPYNYRMQATIVAWDDAGKKREAHTRVMLSMEKSYTAGQLQPGDLIIFTPALETFAHSRLPYAFDYAQYMANKGVQYRQYLRNDDWYRTSYRSGFSLRDYAANIQLRCVDNLYKSGINTTHAHILAAILWGYKGNIPDTMRDYFSTAGLSHILAVSGLHTGIIIFLLWLILYPLQYIGCNKSRHIITIVLLWAYAFITGLSPSVIRACIMATFIAVAVLINRRNTSLNALCGSAFVVLLINPLQLFDVGFQLSYAAVTGILLLAPYLDLSQQLNIKHAAVQYICGALAVTLAAQLGTTLLAAYYFNYIPTLSLLSNLLITPLLPLLVIAALATQLFTALHIQHEALTTLTDTLTHTLLRGADSIAALPRASIEGVSVSPLILLLYTIALAALWYTLSRKNLKSLIVILGAILAIQVYTLYETTRPSQPLVILPAQRGSSNIQLADAQHNCYILTTDTTAGLPPIGEEWRIHEHLDTRRVAPGDTIVTPHIYIAPPFIQYYGHRLLWVDDNIWRYCQNTQPIAIDYVIITEKYRGKISHLSTLFTTQNIVLTTAIHPEKAQQLQAECNERDLNCIMIEEHTTLHLTPKQ